MKQFLLLSFYIFLFVLLPLTKTLPQEEDPWGINSTGPRTVKSQDVFLLFMNNGGGEIYQKIYRAKPEALANPSDVPDFINTMISETETKEDTRKGSDRQVDVATGRFNVDPYDDVVAVWRTLGNDHKIEISIPAFDSTGIFQSSFKYTLDAGERIRLDDHIYVRTGDFDGDGLDEFVVTVLNLSNHIRYFIFDVDTTNGMLQPVLIHNYTSQHTVTDDQIKTEKRVRYIIETADLNSDGIDEIVSFNHEGDFPSNNIFIPAKCRVYTIENDVIVPKGTQDLHLYKSVANYQITMAVAKGQLIPGPNEELVFCSVTSGGQTFPTTSSVHFAHLFIIDATADLQTIHQHDKIIDLEDPSFNHNCRPITDFGLATGDLDLDSNGRDEIVYIAGERIRIAKIEDNTSITLKGSILIANGGPYDYTQSDNYIKVKDVNMDNREDIIVVKHLTQDATNLPKGFATYFITMDNSLEKPDVLGRLLNDENENYNYRKYAIAVGNFDGLDFKVGYPYPKVTVLGLKQPIVLLNAPPTHFDKFGNDIFDVNGCFNGNNCNFTATYQHTQGNTMEVNTSVHRDWMISGGFKVSGSVGAGTTLNYEAHLLLNYGEHYSKDSTHRTTISSSTSVHTTGDDQIFYTSTDYDFWEYPIYHDNETFPRRSFLVADPKHTEGAWTNSKSVNSVNYVPDHEVGNILSYSDDVTSNPYVGDTIRVQYGSTTFVINNNSSFGWDLVHNDFTTNNTETTKEVELAWALAMV